MQTFWVSLPRNDSVDRFNGLRRCRPTAKSPHISLQREQLLLICSVNTSNENAEIIQYN